MRNITNKGVIYLLLTFLLINNIACKKKTTTKTSALPSKMLNNDFTFNYLTTKAHIDFLSPDQNLSTPAQVKIKQDSAIWISVTPALGIEMMKIVIRKDSVFMLNRIKKEYYAGSFDLIREQLGLNVNYALIEKLLLGNIPLKSSSNEKLTKTETHYILEQMLKEFTLTNEISKQNARMDKLVIDAGEETGKTTILYANFEPVNNVDFANHITLLQGLATKRTQIDIKYNKVKISDEPISMPFTIPNNYEKLKME